MTEPGAKRKRNPVEAPQVRSARIVAMTAAGLCHAAATTGSPLWVFAATPLYLGALLGASVRESLALGALFGFAEALEVGGAARFGGLAVSLMWLNGMGRNAAVACLLATLRHALARRLCVPLALRPLLIPWVLSGLWWLATAAWARGSGRFYLPLTFGDALGASPMLAQSARELGGGGLSALCVWFGAALVEGLAASTWPRRGLGVGLAAGLLLSLGGLGWHRLAEQPTDGAKDGAPGPPLRLSVRVVQGAVPGWVYAAAPHAPKLEEEIWHRYESLSATPALRPPELIIWPEAAIRPAPAALQGAHERLAQLAARLGAPLLVGAPHVPHLVGTTTEMAAGGPPATSGAPINGALFFGPDGSLAAGGKRWLVPIAEREWQAATQPFQIRYRGLRIGVLICVESLYPELMDELLREGVDLWVVLVNDADLGPGLREIHARRAALRAIEAGVPVVHAAQFHDTRIYDAHGRELARAAGSGPGVVDVRLRWPSPGSSRDRPPGHE